MRVRIAAMLLTLGLAFPADARGPYGSITVAGWSGGAYTNDSTGEFSNCIASAPYKSGITFGVLVTKTLNWALAFTHRSWSLSQGQKFPIVLSFDGRKTFNVDGVAFATNMVIVQMPDDFWLDQKLSCRPHNVSICSRKPFPVRSKRHGSSFTVLGELR